MLKLNQKEVAFLFLIDFNETEGTKIMSDISVQIGQRIHTFRKIRKLTLSELSKIVYKSKSTLSKYETGEIVIDIETLYDIAKALQVQLEQLLYIPPEQNIVALASNECPAFFRGLSRFYSYLFDGRSNRLIRCVFDILGATEGHQYKIMMYMNFKEYNNYQNCENTYCGFIEHYDAMTNISLTNQNTPMEKASAQILASYLDSETKWGLFTGFSSRPMMPIAMKMLFAKKCLKENEELLTQLKVSKEDIRLLKLYNMLSAT